MRLRVKQLICDSPNGIRITQTILAAAMHKSPRKKTAAGSWELDCGAIPG